MICFLTSRADDPKTGELFSSNRFADELRKYLKNDVRALFVCSDPSAWNKTDYYSDGLKSMFLGAGFRFKSFATLDGRNEDKAKDLVISSDLLILSGGHVPTQNRFFGKIRLRELLKDFCGVVIGISAGSMNGAETVYAQPENDGEAVDPDYRRFLPGLGLTNVMLIPHYQEIKDSILDGMKLFEDITFSDSFGRTFYAIPDGSYLFVGRDGEEIRGEAYKISDGVISKVSSDGETVRI